MIKALEQYFPAEAEWTTPQGGLFIWATLPDFIDSEDLLAKALSENVAFVPGSAAYIDGRGASSMRLNFSGFDEETVTEGVRRIGKVIDEQLSLYSTLTGRQAVELPDKDEGKLADIVQLPGIGKIERKSGG